MDKWKRTITIYKKDGKFHWNVSLKDATLYNLGQTFRMDIGNENIIEYKEVQNWKSFETEIPIMNKTFYKYLKQSIKGWKPNAHPIKVKELIKYINYTGVYPVFVLDAIWIRNSYSVGEFTSLFGVKYRQAEKILEAAGYQRKANAINYYLISQRKESVKSCLEKK